MHTLRLKPRDETPTARPWYQVPDLVTGGAADSGGRLRRAAGNTPDARGRSHEHPSAPVALLAVGKLARESHDYSAAMATDGSNTNEPSLVLILPGSSLPTWRPLCS